METINKYQFVSLNETNANWLIPLYKKVFNVSYSLEQILSKYFSTYSGIRAQGHFAVFNGKPIAFHGAIPVLMEFQGKTELSAQYGDAMTLPEHTGQGLFTKLGELTDVVLQENGVKFVWGFPNQNSEYGYVNKLNWLGEKRMKCFILPITTLPSEAVLRKTKLLEQSNQKRIRAKLESMICNETIQSVDSTIHPTIYRSQDYFNYKCFTPNYVIKIDGVQVWVKPLGGLLIGDIKASSKDQLLSAVLALKTLAKKLGLAKVIIQTSPDTPLFHHLKESYTSIDSWLIGYKNFSSEFPLEKLAFTYGDLDTF